MHRFLRVVAVVWLGVVTPSVVWAQAQITGVVRDASGAVLPGVTVEAASDVLIERVRTATTDSSGQYRVIDLRPGTYIVTFSLPGFTTVKREGIELTGAFVATINQELKVGGLAETITVTGETPIVDTQSIRRQTTLTNEVLTSIPTARSWAATAVLIPGIVTQAGSSADVQVTPQMTVFGGAGGRANEGRMQVDGLNTGAALNGGGVSTYVADIANAAEVVTTTSGGLGEAEVGGPTLSIVPKSGGNSVRGSLYLSGVSSGMVGSNFTEDLRTRGLATPGKLLRQWDETFGIGGPIKRDRLWFYATARDEGQHRSIPGIFPNKNAGDPAKWLYEPDTTRQARGAESFQLLSARITFQATPRNRFNLHWDEQFPCNGAAYTKDADACRVQKSDDAFYGAIGLGGLSSTTSPEISGHLGHTLVRNQQLTWSSTLTSRLLLEAGLGAYRARWGPMETPGNPTRALIRVVEQTGVGNGGIPGLTYRSANWANDWDSPTTWRAAASYVAGAHTFKAGYIGGYLIEDIRNYTNDQSLQYTFTGGRPSSVTQFLRPFTQKDRVQYTALYGQDQWTLGRVTLQGALRFDRSWSFSPEQVIDPTNFLPAPLRFERTPGVDSYKDLSPRGGVAWDLRGDGKTAIKFNVGKYLEPAANLSGNYSISNPIARITTQSTRNWNDTLFGAGDPRTGNFIPDCDLTVQTANGECAASNAATFGTATRTTAAIDPTLLNGWSIRPNDWQIGVSVQRQLLSRVSVEGGYFKRWLRNFTATDNLAVTAADYTPFSLSAPVDARLPNGGGYVVDGLYSIVPDKLGQVSNNITDAADFGKQYQSYNGFLVNVTARAAKGFTLQGGVNTGKTVQDSCEVRAQLPELTGGGVSPTVGPTNPWCHSDPGFVTKVTGLGAYTVPKIDVLVSGTFRSDQGAPLRATWAANAVQFVQPALGRPVAGATATSTVSIDLVEPGQVWGDRVNEIDLRVAKVLRFGRTRTTAGFDVYNLINSNAVLTYNQSYNPTGSWLAPLSVLTPRFFKLSAQIEF
jgi:hypothetical protein